MSALTEFLNEYLRILTDRQNCADRPLFLELRIHRTVFADCYPCRPLATAMSNVAHLLRSLVLTAIFSFLAPVIFTGVLFAIARGWAYLPQQELFSQTAVAQIAYFLNIFGNGSEIRGVVLIGTVCSLVGVLFDAYTLYRYQNLGNHE